MKWRVAPVELVAENHNEGVNQRRDNHNEGGFDSQRREATPVEPRPASRGVQAAEGDGIAIADGAGAAPRAAPAAAVAAATAPPPTRGESAGSGGGGAPKKKRGNPLVLMLSAIKKMVLLPQDETGPFKVRRSQFRVVCRPPRRCVSPTAARRGRGFPSKAQMHRGFVLRGCGVRFWWLLSRAPPHLRRGGFFRVATAT